MRNVVMTALALALVSTFDVRAQDETRPPVPPSSELGELPGIVPDEVSPSPDGRLVMIAGERTLHVFDRATRTLREVARGEFWAVEWSPRGDLIAFERTAENDEGAHIWTMPVDPRTGLAAGPPRRITQRHSDSPRFSPDGAWVAFAGDRENGQDVALVPANGGPERIVASEPRGVYPRGFTPDGEWLYYEARIDRSAPDWAFKRVRLSGGSPERIGAGLHLAPGVSPDGRLLAYGDTSGVWMIADQDARPIAAFDLPNATGGVAWSRRSTGLLAAVVEESSSLALLALRENASPRELSAAGRSTSRRPSGRMYGAFSPDGRWLATQRTSENGTMEIVILDADGSWARSIRTRRQPFGPDPVWSPDSRLLAVRVAEGRGIDVIDATAGTARAMETADGRIHQMAWSADSRSIRYVHLTEGDRAAEDRISVRETTISGDDRLVRQIGSWSSIEGLSFAGLDRVLVGRRQDTRLSVLDLASGERRELDAPPGSRPAVSRGGRFVARAVRGSAGAHDALWVGSTETGEGRVIPLGFEASAAPPGLVWHPDGSRIFTSGTPLGGGPQRIYSITLAGGGALALTKGVGGGEYLGDVSPDGETLAIGIINPPRAKLVEFDLTGLISAGQGRNR